MSAHLEIVPPTQFHHAGKLASRHDTGDPRLASFAYETVDVDLRKCEFLRPPAMLWCVVFLALAARRGTRCRLLVPENMGVAVHLKSTGVLEKLRERGVEVDDRGVRVTPDPKAVLPLTHFQSLEDVQRLANHAHDRLRSAGFGSVNLSTVVSELFSELANNASEHSESPIGAFGCIQFVEAAAGSRFTCVVADGGIGIRGGLCKSPELRRRVLYDWDAVELATRERVSGTSDPHRGIGLFAVAEDARQLAGSFLLHSGIGLLEIREDRATRARRTRLFPGTLAYLSVPS